MTDNHARSITIMLDALDNEQLCKAIVMELAKRNPDTLCELVPIVKSGVVSRHVHAAATQYVALGNEMEAIKLVREVTGWGVKAAKEFVDSDCQSGTRFNLIEVRED